VQFASLASDAFDSNFMDAPRETADRKRTDNAVMPALVREPVGPGSLRFLDCPNSAVAEFGWHPRFTALMRFQGVDGRDKPGHDESIPRVPE
jgi:hypothetical protein